MARKKVIEQDSNPKKVCSECKKEKRLKEFYKVSGIHFPDGHLGVCSSCIKEQVDVNDVNSVIVFLRSIDKPFFETEWNNSLTSGRPPLSEYIRKANSLPVFRGKKFDDSDGMSSLGSIDVSKLIVESDIIETDDGEIIKFSESLASKWGSGYMKHEILQMEKFYQDMMLSYEVTEANHKNMLIRLAKLSIEMDNLLAKKDYTAYEKVNKVYSKTLQDAGFRPIDRKNGSDSVGLFSFSQVWAEVEKEGFIPPNLVEYEKDDIDYMLLYYQQWVQRLVGKEVSEVPDSNWRNDVKNDSSDKEEGDTNG